MNTIDLVIEPYIQFLNLLVTNGYAYKPIVGSRELWKKTVEETYKRGSKQIFILGGDYENDLEFIDDKQDAIFLRQSFISSKKKNNEILIPSSYGCVAGDINMEICKITDIPKISFCGSKNSHLTRCSMFTILENNENIKCNFFLLLKIVAARLILIL